MSFPSYSRVPGGSGPSPLQAITLTGPRPPGAPRLPEHLDLATSPKPACPSGDNWDCTLIRRVWGGPEPRPAAGQGPGLSTWQCLEHGEPWAVPRLHTREWTPCRGQGEGAGAPGLSPALRAAVAGLPVAARTGPAGAAPCLE